MKQNKTKKEFGGMIMQKKKSLKNMKWSGFDSQQLINKWKGQVIQGIVEQVLSATSLKVLVGESVVTVQLTGISGPKQKIIKKKNEKGEEKEEKIFTSLGLEAKLFTELQLHHRDVSVLFEGVDNHNNFNGSIVLGNGKCFQELLVSEGLAQILDWNIGNTKFSTNIRKVEQETKKKKLKIFKNYKPSESTLSEEDKKSYTGFVVQVLTGDSVKIKREDNGIEERVFLSSIKAPKFKQQRGDKVFSKYEEFAYESKEFLREKLSQNSLVQIKVDYKRSPGTKNDKKEKKNRENNRENNR